jgi:hypothetical protein
VQWEFIIYLTLLNEIYGINYANFVSQKIFQKQQITYTMQAGNEYALTMGAASSVATLEGCSNNFCVAAEIQRTAC